MTHLFNVQQIHLDYIDCVGRDSYDLNYASINVLI